MNQPLQFLVKALQESNFWFNDWPSFWRIAFSTISLFVILILVLNLFGKRSIADLSMHDHITTLAIGSIVSSTLILEEITLLNGLVSIVLMLALQFLVTFLASRFPNFFSTLNPKPVCVFLKGDYLENNLKKTRTTKEEVLSAIRRNSGTSSDQVFAVILERNGALSVITSVSAGYEEEITKYIG